MSESLEADEIREEYEIVGGSTKVHQCPNCGGIMNFDPTLGSLKCQYCGHVKDIEKEALVIVENSFKGALTEGVRSWSDEDVKSVNCKNCGAELIFDAHTKAQFCSYCGSSHIEEHVAKKTIPPAYILPFGVDEKKAYASFATWIKSRWFAPNDLKNAYKHSKLLGTYVPHWTYDALTSSYYTAQRGDYYYVTRTRTVNGKTETYQERRTRWTNVSGGYDRTFDDVLVCGSKKVEASVKYKIGGFDLRALTAYQPAFLSGFLAERYSVSLEEGWEEARHEIDQVLDSEIRSRIGGDEVRALNIRSTYDDVTYKHILLPVWISSYEYKSEVYQFMINGQSGKVGGRYPKSAIKIALAIAVGVIVVLVAYMLISANTSGSF